MPAISQCDKHPSPGFQMTSNRISQATPTDLRQLNDVIQRAVSTWQLPERVRRLTAPFFTVDEQDLRDRQWLVSKNQDGTVVGVAHWTKALGYDLPEGCQGAAVIHGLYVDSTQQRRTVGTSLLRHIDQLALQADLPALVVRAQRSAESYFVSQQFRPLRDEPDGPTYPRGLWRPTGQAWAGQRSDATTNTETP